MKKYFIFLILTFPASVYGQTHKISGSENITVLEANSMEVENKGGYFFSEIKEATENYNKGVELPLSKINEKINYYIKAISYDSNFVEAFDNLGRLYRVQGEFDKAIECYKSSIKLFPGGRVSHMNLALIYNRQKSYQLALIEYFSLIEIDSQDPEGYYGASQIYLNLNELDESLKFANHALRLYELGDYDFIEDCHFLIGLIHYFKNDYTNSRFYILKSIDEGYSKSKIHHQVLLDLKIY